MIKTVEQIANELGGIYRVGSHKEFREVLKKYIEEIIDECGQEVGKLAFPGTEEMVQTVVTVNVKKQL